MCKKECCKNCEWLNYYDTYFCGNDLVQDAKDKSILIIEDKYLGIRMCELYQEREGKFWLNGEW